MLRMKKSLLSLTIIAAATALSVEAATDAERIRMLEEQLQQQKAMMEQQQRMLEAMDAELKRLKAGEPEPAIATAPAEPAEKMPVLVTGDKYERALSVNI